MYSLPVFLCFMLEEHNLFIYSGRCSVLPFTLPHRKKSIDVSVETRKVGLLEADPH